MRQVLVILRGASASGKSTIGESLRDFDKKIVWLRTDSFKLFFSKDAKEEALDAVMDAALATLNSILAQGYSVVYDGIFKKPEYAQKAIDLAKSKNVPVIIYQLECSLETLKQRDKNKAGVKEGWKKPLGDERIEILFNKVENNPIEGAIKLNTEEKSVEECIRIIRKNFE